MRSSIAKIRNTASPQSHKAERKTEHGFTKWLISNKTGIDDICVDVSLRYRELQNRTDEFTGDKHLKKSEMCIKTTFKYFLQHLCIWKMTDDFFSPLLFKKSNWCWWRVFYCFSICIWRVGSVCIVYDSSGWRNIISG